MKKKQLKEFANLLNGYAFKSKNYVSSGIRIIRIANVKDGYISDEQPCYYPEDTFEDIEKYILKTGDILISLTGNVGRIGIMPSNMLPAALNQRVACIRLKDNSVNKKYLFYYLQRKSFVEDCIKASKGVAQLNLSTKWLEEYSIPIPLLPEQERIVTRIEELFSELDKAVETLKTTKQQLAVYRQAVLKEAFSCADTFEPFGSIMTSRLGKMLDKEKNVGLPEQYIRNINVRWFSFDLSDLLKMRIETKEIEKYSIKYGDLIICEGGEPGRCAVWDRNDSIFYQKALHRVRFKNGENPKLYMYYLWFISQTGELEKYFTGTGIKHLTGQSLLKVPVPIISISKQNTVVLKIESQLSVCNQIEKMIEQSLQQAEAMRQSILKQAFEGRLV